ncbi:hypothetical protein TNCV_1938321 [Trichonephila clavipes]|nr:hypothetical protein TNCV_1938321 [Trichonephila clavipes]
MKRGGERTKEKEENLLRRILEIFSRGIFHEKKSKRTLKIHCAVDYDNLCTAPIIAEKDFFEFVHSSKHIVDADSDDENEIDDAAPIPTSFEMRNVMKSLHSYLDAHSKGETNNKQDDIEHVLDNLLQQHKETYPIYLSKTQNEKKSLHAVIDKTTVWRKNPGIWQKARYCYTSYSAGRGKSSISVMAASDDECNKRALGNSVQAIVDAELCHVRSTGKQLCSKDLNQRAIHLSTPSRRSNTGCWKHFRRAISCEAQREYIFNFC